MLGLIQEVKLSWWVPERDKSLNMSVTNLGERRGYLDK